MAYLNVLHVLQEWSLHHMSQEKAFRLDIEIPLSDLLDSLPVALLHRLVKHSLQQWTSLVEVINLFLQIIESLPLLQRFGKFTAPVSDAGENERRERKVKEERQGRDKRE